MLKYRHLNAIGFALCLLAPWSLLWLDASLIFPYETGKAWVFRLINELAFVVYLIQYFIQPPPGSQGLNKVMLGLLALYLAWSLLTLLTGIDPYRSFWSNYERMAGFISMLHWAMYFLCLRSVLSVRRIEIFTLNLLLIIAVICGLSGLDSEKRAISTLGNPIYLGNVAVLGLFITGFWLSSIHRSPTKLKWFWGLFALLVFILAGAALLNAASRGPILALAAGLIGMIIFACFYLLRAKIAWAVLVLLVACAAMLGGMVDEIDTVQKALKQSDLYAISRLGDVSMSNQTTADRLENWRIALDASKTHPILGWGQGNYMIAFTEHYRAGVMDNARIWFDRAHNAYLDVLVASGYPGLVLYLLMLGFPLFLVSRRAQWSAWQKGFIAGFLVAYMAKSLVGFDTFSSTLLWLTVLALITVDTTTDRTQNDCLLQRQHYGVLLGLIAVYMMGAYWLNIKPYQDNQILVRLSKNQQIENKAADRAFPNGFESVADYAVNSKLRVLTVLLTQALNHPRRLNRVPSRELLVRQAGELIRRELERQPRNYRISYNASILLVDLGHFDLAIQLLESLVHAAPDRTVFWHRLAQTYSAAGVVDKAAQATEKVHQLNPKWRP